MTHAKRVLTNPQCYLQLSILNPTATFTLPPRQLADGVADAFLRIDQRYLA